MCIRDRNKRAGADNGMRAEFGFNLTGVEEKIDMSEVVTRIRPKAYNGHMLPNNETVDSPNIEKYEPRRFPPVVFEYTDIKLKEDAQEGDEENGITICDTKAILYQKLRAVSYTHLDVYKRQDPRFQKTKAI